MCCAGIMVLGCNIPPEEETTEHLNPELYVYITGSCVVSVNNRKRPEIQLKCNIDTAGVAINLYSCMYRQDKPNRQIDRLTNRQVELCNMHQRKKKQKPVMYQPTLTAKSNCNGYILFIIPLSHSLKYPFRMRTRMRIEKKQNSNVH